MLSYFGDVFFIFGGDKHMRSIWLAELRNAEAMRGCELRIWSYEFGVWNFFYNERVLEF